MDRGQGDNQQLAAGRQMGGVRVHKVKGKFTLRGATPTVTHSEGGRVERSFHFYFFFRKLKICFFF